VPLLLGVLLIGGGIVYGVKYAGGNGKTPGGSSVSAEELAGIEWEKQLNKRFVQGMFRTGDGSEDKDTYEQTWKAMERERDGNLKQAADLCESEARNAIRRQNRRLEVVGGETDQRRRRRR